MTSEWKVVVDSFIDIFSNMDFSSGPLFYVIGIVIAGYCCLEGIKIYKMILLGLGFLFGYRVGYLIFHSLGWSGEKLLMAEVFLGLVIATLAYKIYLAGIFIAVFQFGQVNMPIYVEQLIGDDIKAQYGSFIGRILITIISLLAAILVAKLAVNLSRTIIVCITAVVGGFAVINLFVQLLDVFPYEITLPAASSVIWLGAKVFLSMAGVGIQGTKDEIY
ncbi:MAG: hypothetical protein K5894_03230 [Lachnospiraceae bacterium]|nr:hypothetical protein [Lachnospiraceae bacterium]